MTDLLSHIHVDVLIRPHVASYINNIMIHQQVVYVAPYIRIISNPTLNYKLIPFLRDVLFQWGGYIVYTAVCAKQLRSFQGIY